MPKSSHSQPLVLVIDDDQMMRLLVCEVLEPFALRIEEAGDGMAGLHMIETLRPDIVLLDVMMPEVDGFAVCRAIRARPDSVLTPVLMMTGLDDTESIELAYQAGATDFIIKPINWPILGHRVRYMLGASEALGKLASSEANLASAQRIAAVGSWEWDAAQDKLHCSEEMGRLCGLVPGVTNIGFQDFLHCVHPDDRESVERSIRDSLVRRMACSIEHRIRLSDGSERVVHAQAEVLTVSNDHPNSMHGTLQDISERRAYERKLQYHATHDALTGLPNRSLLMDRLAAGDEPRPALRTHGRGGDCRCRPIQILQR